MGTTFIAPFQRIFGKDHRFFELLEAGGEEARSAVLAATGLLRNAAEGPSLDVFVSCRRKGRQIHDAISEHVIRSFVTSLEREDTEDLSDALYKIPKAAEKFAERFLLYSGLVRGVDFRAHAEAMDQAVERALVMLRMLRRGGDLERITVLSAALGRTEHEADQFVHKHLRALYSPQREFLEVLALRDVYLLLERIVNRCAEVGTIVTHIILKHS